MNMQISTVGLATLLGACGAAYAELAYGVTSNQTLVSFDTSAPTAIQSGVAISGLQNNEQIRGIDFRPANGMLYALGSFNNLYTIDTATGAASLVGSGLGLSLSGSSFGFDFNPVIDRIRVVSDAGNNYVLNPDTGTGTQVTSLFYAGSDANAGMTPNVTASAYTNNSAGTTSTQLYGIDTGLDILVRQANSAGTLETVGFLGADIVDMAGFDISGTTGMAYAVSIENGATRSVLWSIDLNTGAATMLGEIGGGSILTSFAVVPAPGVVSLAMPLALAGLRRRR
ncbi:MAG: DUF4394 domain-containing protein [Planctomycetota bacterium]|nr:MAG: DUF4394 domain-containing protein [Planctomycetota bacterium]